MVDGGLMVWASEMTLCCGKGDRAHERKIERGQAGAGGGGSGREGERDREGTGTGIRTRTRREGEMNS